MHFIVPMENIYFSNIIDIAHHSVILIAHYSVIVIRPNSREFSVFNLDNYLENFKQNLQIINNSINYFEVFNQNVSTNSPISYTISQMCIIYQHINQDVQIYIWDFNN